MSEVPSSPGLGHGWVERADGRREEDDLAVEEPLEIRVDGEALAILLRTPGHDRELVAGFLFAEGLIEGAADLEALEPIQDPARPGRPSAFGALLRPEGRDRVREGLAKQRDFLLAAGCGLCGKRQLSELNTALPRVEGRALPRPLIESLPRSLRSGQTLFARTGGVHAAGLFSEDGHSLAVFEDIGRHNALDKLIGQALLSGQLPLGDRVVVISSRAGYEMVQKALRAGAPTLVAVGAASDLAASLARGQGMALYTFVARGQGNRHL